MCRPPAAEGHASNSRSRAARSARISSSGSSVPGASMRNGPPQSGAPGRFGNKVEVDVRHQITVNGAIDPFPRRQPAVSPRAVRATYRPCSRRRSCRHEFKKLVHMAETGRHDARGRSRSGCGRREYPVLYGSVQSLPAMHRAAKLTLFMAVSDYTSKAQDLLFYSGSTRSRNRAAWANHPAQPWDTCFSSPTVARVPRLTPCTPLP